MELRTWLLGYGAVLALLTRVAATEDPAEIAARGDLTEAARAYEALASADGSLRASVCYVRAGWLRRARACAEGASRRRPARDVAAVWARWLRGDPVRFPPRTELGSHSPAECYVAALVCRLCGASADERRYMRAAWERNRADPLVGAELLRTLGRKDGAAVLGHVPPSAERTLVEAEWALAAGNAGTARRLLEALRDGAPRDPRIGSLAAAAGCEWPEAAMPEVERWAAGLTFAIPRFLAALDRSEKGAEAAGLTRRAYVDRQWETFFGGIRQQADELIEESGDAPLAHAVLRVRARFFGDATRYGAATGLFRAQARVGLGDGLALLIGDPHSVLLSESTLLSETATLWRNLNVGVAFDEFARSYLRQVVSPAVHARLRLELARHLRLAGRPELSEPILAALVAERAWGLEASDLEEEDLRRGLALCRLQQRPRVIDPAEVKVLGNGTRSLPPSDGRVLVMEFYDRHCGWCKDGLKTLKRWQADPTLRDVEFLAVGVKQGSDDRREWSRKCDSPVLDDAALEERLCDLFQVASTPVYAVIDSAGTILAVAVGIHELPSIERVLRAPRPVISPRERDREQR